MTRRHAVLFGLLSLSRSGMASEAAAATPTDVERCVMTAAFMVSMGMENGGLPPPQMYNEAEGVGWTCCQFLSMAAGPTVTTFDGTEIKWWDPFTQPPPALSINEEGCGRVFKITVDAGDPDYPGLPQAYLPKTYEHSACSDFFYRETMPGYMKKDKFGGLGVRGVDFGTADPDEGVQFLFTPGYVLETVGSPSSWFPGPNMNQILKDEGICTNKTAGECTILSTKPADDMPEEITIVAVILLSIAIGISIVSTFLAYKRTYYHYPLRGQFCTILILPGITAAFAICECYATKLKASHLLFFDCQCTMRCVYLLSVVSFSLDMLAMRNGGMTSSVEEAAEKVGLDLEKLMLPRRKYSMTTMMNVGPFWMGPSPFLGVSKVSEWFAQDYVPNRAFLHSCVWRIKAAGYGFAFCTVMRPFTMDINKHADALDPLAPDTAYLWLLCIALFLMSLGMSGMLALYEIVDPLANPTPDQQFTDKLRKLHFVFFFFIIGLGHGTIALISSNLYPDTFEPFWAGLKMKWCYNSDSMTITHCPITFDGIPCLWMIYYEPIFLAIELVIVTILGYRCWLPPFKFQGCPCAPFEVDTSDPMSVFLNAADMHTGSYEKMQQLLSTQMSENYVSMSDDLVKDIFTGAISVKDAKAKQTEIVKSAPTSTTSSGTADVEVKVLSASKVA